MGFKRIVVKIGTSTVTGGSKKVDMPQMIDLVRQLSLIKDSGADVVLVSSGAVATGRELLGYPNLSKHVPGKQMLASIGQPRLMSIYMNLFDMYGSIAAQILLNRKDTIQRTSYLNARNTLELLFEQRVIPIVNENDTTATDEIRLGDNDTLSAYVSGMIGADLLILMTDTPGLFDCDPCENPDARLIEYVDSPEIPDAVWNSAGGSKSGLGTGGMLTKVRAADIARRMGATVKIVDGKIPNCLPRIVAGETFGTTFTAVHSILDSRKRYLLSGYRADGAAIMVDAGAARALLNGKSLLPAGITGVSGTFQRGDTVRILQPDGHEVATGMANYNWQDITQLVGKQASEIEMILGYSYADEIVHHDNMVFYQEYGDRK